MPVRSCVQSALKWRRYRCIAVTVIECSILAHSVQHFFKYNYITK